MIAVAARVIQRGDGWLCTALRLIYPNPRR
jgi:hypothetical protein